MGAEVAFFIEPILDLLGFKSLNQIQEDARNKVIALAQELQADWQQKQSMQPYTSTEALASNMPTLSQIKRDIYEKYSNRFTRLQKNLQEARDIDEKSARNNWLTNLGGDIANTVVNTVTFGATHNVVADEQNKWKNENQNKVLDQMRNLKSDFDKEMNQVNRDQISSYNKNYNQLMDYKKGLK